LHDLRIVPAASTVNKRLQYVPLALLDPIPVRYHIHRYIILLELFRELHHALLIRRWALEWRGNKNNDALTEILVLAVFEGELGDGQRRGDIDRTGDFGGGCMEGRENLANFFCVCY